MADYEKYEPGREESRVLQEVWERWKDDQAERNRRLLDYRMNVLYLNRDQWATLNRRLGVIYYPAQAMKRLLVVNDKLRPRLRRRISEFRMQNIEFFCLPWGTSEADAQRARIGEGICQRVWEQKKCSVLDRIVLWYMQAWGDGFIYIGWNPRAKAYVPGPDGQMVLSEVGDIELEAPRPMEMLLDDAARGGDVSRMRRIGRVRLVEVEELRLRYPAIAQYIAPQEDNEVMQASAGTYEPFFDAQRRERYRDRCVPLIQYWEVPSHRYPQGRFINALPYMILRDSLDDDLVQPLPYEDGELPFEQFGDQVRLDSPWHTSTVTLARELQRFYNIGSTQLEERKNLESMGVILFPLKGLSTPVTRLSGEFPACAMPYTPVGQHIPTPLNWQTGTVDQLRAHLAFLEREMDEKFGFGEASLGRPAPGVRSAKQVQMLQTADVAGNSDSMTAYISAWERVFMKVLSRYRQYAIEPRILQMVGHDEIAEVRNFKGSDLPIGMIVRIVAEQGSGQMKQRRKLELLEAAQYLQPTLQSNPGFQRAFFKAFDLRTPDAIFDSDRKDRARARAENARLKMGERVEVNSFDNHAVHIMEHELEQKGLAYDQLPDWIKFNFEVHKAQHVGKESGKIPSFSAEVLAAAGFSAAVQPTPPGPVGVPPTMEQGEIPQGPLPGIQTVRES